MADSKNTDGLFHWKFELSEGTDGFTDITYAPKTEAENDPQEDIRIFVPPVETPRKRENAGDFVERYVNDKASQYEKPAAPVVKATDRDIEISFTETASDKGGLAAAPVRPSRTPAAAARTGSAPARNTRPQYASEKNEAYRQAKKPVTGQKKKKKNNKSLGVNYKRLAFFVLLLAVAAGLTVLAVKLIRGGKSKNWSLAEENSEVTGLMTSYYDCVQNPHANTMRTLLDPNAKVNAQTLSMKANIIESIDQLKVYTIRGVNKGEYVIMTTYEILYKNISTAFPKFEWFYARPDTTGTLRLLTENEYNVTTEKEIQTYMGEVCQLEDIKVIWSEVNTKANKALAQDEELKAFQQQLKNGDYTPWSGGEEATEPEETVPAETVPAETEPVADQVCGYIAKSDVRMRATPVDGEVLATFEKGHYLYIISTESGSDGHKWYKVSDSLSTNKATGMTQTKSGLSGYIRDDLLSMSYPD